MKAAVGLKRSFMVLLALVMLPAATWAVDIKSIVGSPRQYEDEVVEVMGFIDRHERDAATGTDYYVLRDDYADEIRVRTTRGLPEVDDRYRVKAVVTIHAVTKSVYLHEESRTLLSEAPPPPPPPPLPEEETNMALVFGIVLIVAVVVVVVVLVLSRRKPRPALEPVSEPAPAPSTAPEPEPVPPPAPSAAETQIFENKTVKIETAPTMKFLPGAFEVRTGEKAGEKVRLNGYPTPEGAEVTIGREAPTDAQRKYAHILLKEKTVSRRQAKLVFKDGTYSLVNLGATNPTQVNGAPLGVDESASLKDGDLIRFGEVELKFHAEA